MSTPWANSGFSQLQQIAGRLSLWHVLALACLISLIPHPAEAQYTTRASVTTSGALTFTGNAFGLDGDEGGNRPGTRGAIGTFTTTDTSQQDGSFPNGTTNDWRQNRSEANPRLPVGARVIRAELIWGGTFAGGERPKCHQIPRNADNDLRRPAVSSSPAVRGSDSSRSAT